MTGSACGMTGEEMEAEDPTPEDVDWSMVQEHHREVWRLGAKLHKLRKQEQALQKERRELEKRCKAADQRLHELLYGPIKANPEAGRPY